MFEKPPEFPIVLNEQIPNKEREHISYEQALTAARFLHAANVKNPTSGEYDDPEVQAASDTIDQWELDSGLRMKGVGTVEKARTIVLSATILLDAGYTDPEVVRSAREHLNSEHVVALREGNEEVTEILASAIEELERKFPSVDSKQERMNYLQGKLEEGQRFLADQKPGHAVTTLYGTLTDPFFKRNKKMTGELRKKLEALLAIAEVAYAEERKKEKKLSES